MANVVKVKREPIFPRGVVSLGVLVVISGLFLTGCGDEVDDATMTEMESADYSLEVAEELNKAVAKLSEEELRELVKLLEEGASE